MYTPAGFNPSHVLPDTLPATTLAFAFRGERILVGGDEKAPAILTQAEFSATGLDGPTLPRRLPGHAVRRGHAA